MSKLEKGFVGSAVWFWIGYFILQLALIATIGYHAIFLPQPRIMTVCVMIASFRTVSIIPPSYDYGSKILVLAGGALSILLSSHLLVSVKKLETDLFIVVSTEVSVAILMATLFCTFSIFLLLISRFHQWIGD